MKHTRKLISILLTLVIALALATTASATETTVTVTNNTTHTYKAYQIFAADASTEGTSTTLSNVTWGAGLDTTYLSRLVSTLKTEMSDVFGTLSDSATAKDVAEALSGKSEAVGQQFANILVTKFTNDSSRTSSYLSGSAFDTINGKESASAAAATGTLTKGYGYYLLVDVTANSAHTAAIVQATPSANGLTIKDKTESIAAVPGKSVEGSTGTTVGKGVGEVVSFRIWAQIPENISNYETYPLLFKDTATNLSINRESVKVFTADNSAAAYSTANAITMTLNEAYGVIAPFGAMAVEEMNKAYGVFSSGNVDTLYVSFLNVKTLQGDTDSLAGKYIIVTYDATVLSTAVTSGAENEVQLMYYNDPYETTSPTPIESTKPQIELKNTGLEIKAQKDGAADTKLDASYTVKKGSSYLKDTDGTLSWVTSADEATAFATGEDGVVTIPGALGAGEYTVTEVVAPAGYNSAEAQSFTVTVDASGNVSVGEDDPATYGDGKVTVTFVYNAGTVLPETGGIGTTLFYAIGGLLVLGAVVLLVTRKRMSAEK